MNWLTAIAVHQDYLWALSLFLWLAVLLAWWQTRRREPDAGWVLWVAGTGLLIALMELSLLNTPVKPKPFIPSRLPWDAALGFITWALAAGLLWTRLHGRAARLAGLVALILLGGAGLWSVRDVRPFGEARALHPILSPSSAEVRMEAFVDPADVTGWRPLVLARLSTLSHQGAGWGLSGALVLGVIACAAGPRSRLGRISLVLVAAAQLFSTYGPVSDWVGLARASTQLSVLGPLAATLQLGAAASLLAATCRGGDSPRLAAAFGGAEMRLLAIVLALWLCLGLVLASIMGALARTQFEAGALGRARSAALLIDTELLARGLGPEFRFAPPRTEHLASRRTVLRTESPYLTTGVFRPLEQTLALIGRANPDVNQARISTLRSGWLVAVCSPADYPGFRSNVSILRPITGALRDDWARRAAAITRPYAVHYGELSFATAPLITRNGRMLGWLQLEFGASVWLAHQAQARLLAFLIVGLGMLLIVLFFQHRRQASLRDQAQQAEAMAQAASRTKTAFLAKVSHELRTPIQSIIGYGELMATRPLPQEQAGWLAAQRSQSRLLIRLVNDLIDLSAMQAGAFRLTPRPADLADLVLSTVESLRPVATAKALALSCVIDPQFPCWWWCDTERIRQIVLNLTGNAIKFTTRGSVTVRLALDPARAGLVRLTVTDTGPGIVAEDIPRLFQPFSRLEQAQDIEGSGLGLALSSSLCAAMHGALSVESDGRNGATFSALFVLKPAKDPSLTQTAGPATLAGWQVLVVDDNPMVRDLFVTGLQLHGATCSTADDGLAALELAGQREFQAIVLDLSMPWLDGCEAARRLRARPGHRPRIVGVSAHAGAEERERALAAGMDAFLIKPVELPDLVAAINHQPAPAARPLDQALLARFREQFRLESASLGAGLRSATRDVPLLRRRIHYLKNSADVVQHRAIADICRKLEQHLALIDSAGFPDSQAADLLAALQKELALLDTTGWPGTV